MGLSGLKHLFMRESKNASKMLEKLDNRVRHEQLMRCLCRYQVFQMLRHSLDLHRTVITVHVQEKTG